MNIKTMSLDLTFKIAKRLTYPGNNKTDAQIIILELLTALHDTIKLDAGQVPESAFKFYCEDEFKGTDEQEKI